VQHESASDSDRLTDLTAFGRNLEQLRARTYVPAQVLESAPLVVVLQGCTQSSAMHDYHAGWSRLAGAMRFTSVNGKVVPGLNEGPDSPAEGQK
jgi:poly(3-hydroxybutyrate) depolymerase